MGDRPTGPGPQGKPPQNIEFARLPELSWEPARRGASPQALADYVADEAESAIRWYLDKKDHKRAWAQQLRFLAIFATALAGLIPLLAEIFVTDGKPDISPAWASVALAVAASCALLDRFGYSSTWMRFLTTEMKVRHALHDFLLDWETRRAAWEGKNDPGLQELEAGLKHCKDFLKQINEIVRSETDTWVTESRVAITEIEVAAKVPPEAIRPGVANLTVTNGEQCADGWRLSIDGGAEERVAANPPPCAISCRARIPSACPARLMVARGVPSRPSPSPPGRRRAPSWPWRRPDRRRRRAAQARLEALLAAA